MTVSIEPDQRKRVAILISGRGSNMAALLAAMRGPGFPARPVLVLSNVGDAGGLEIAQAAGVATAVVDHRAHATREAFDREVNTHLLAHEAEIVCLAGFMRLLSPWFCATWRGKLINIHPSLLPRHKGLHTHRRALTAGDAVHGCTVHFVTEELDGGPVILQSEIPVLAGDTEAALAQRVLTQEHLIYPQALARVALGEAKI